MYGYDRSKQWRQRRTYHRRCLRLSVANAPAGFTAAVNAVVDYYESHFTNPVTVTIDVGYGEVAGMALDLGALGESETALTSVSYSQLETALANNANAIGDTALAASLSATSPVSGATYYIATAEAEALGLSAPVRASTATPVLAAR